MSQENDDEADRRYPVERMTVKHPPREAIVRAEGRTFISAAELAELPGISAAKLAALHNAADGPPFTIVWDPEVV